MRDNRLNWEIFCFDSGKNRRTIITVNKSVFVDKKSREQFQIKVHKRIMDLMNSTSKTVDALMKLDMPAGVDIEIRT